MTHAAPPPDALERTTISIYREDADWLRQFQREISFHRDTYVTLHDLIHELIINAKTIEETSRNAPRSTT